MSWICARYYYVYCSNTQNIAKPVSDVECKEISIWCHGLNCRFLYGKQPWNKNNERESKMATDLLPAACTLIGEHDGATYDLIEGATAAADGVASLQLVLIASHLQAPSGCVLQHGGGRYKGQRLSMGKKAGSGQDSLINILLLGSACSTLQSKASTNIGPSW